MKGNIYPVKYGYMVRYGRAISLFAKNKQLAERILNGLRFKDDEGTLDPQDYQRGNPLKFKTQAKKWLRFSRFFILKGM